MRRRKEREGEREEEGDEIGRGDKGQLEMIEKKGRMEDERAKEVSE